MVCLQLSRNNFIRSMERELIVPASLSQIAVPKSYPTKHSRLAEQFHKICYAA